MTALAASFPGAGAFSWDPGRPAVPVCAMTHPAQGDPTPRPRTKRAVTRLITVCCIDGRMISPASRSLGWKRDVGRMSDLGDLVQADVVKLAVHPPDLLHVHVEDGIAVGVVAERTGGADVADVLERLGQRVVVLGTAADGPERFPHRLRRRP